VALPLLWKTVLCVSSSDMSFGVPRYFLH
jgi:hypothetical protein